MAVFGMRWDVSLPASFRRGRPWNRNAARGWWGWDLRGCCRRAMKISGSCRRTPAIPRTTYDNPLTTLSSELKTCVTWLSMAIYIAIYALHWEALIRSFMNMLVRTPARWKRALQEQVLHKPCATCMLNLAAKQGKRMTFAPHSFPFAMTMYEDPCTTKHLQSFAMFVVFLCFPHSDDIW